MSEDEGTEKEQVSTEPSVQEQKTRPVWPIGFVPDRLASQQRERDLMDVQRMKKQEQELQQRLDEADLQCVQARLDQNQSLLVSLESLHTLWKDHLDDVRRERIEIEKYIEQNKVQLSRWEKDLDPELRLKFRDATYLPTRAEVLSLKHFQNYCDEFGDYEILSREYLKAFGDQLLFDVRSLLKKREEIQILEVGAGSGRLTHFLSEYVLRSLSEEEQKVIRFVASDSFEEQIPPVFDVQQIKTKEAVEQIKPSIVITSWSRISVEEIVNGAPWIEEVVVIGEPGICAGGDEGGWRPVRGFSMKRLLNATALQICRTDLLTSDNKLLQHSNTTIYKRRKSR